MSELVAVRLRELVVARLTPARQPVILVAKKVIGSGGSGGSSGGGTAATTTFTPAGTVAATDVQAAIVEVSGDVTAEASARASADTTNATAITTEASTRASADSSEASTRAAADALLLVKSNNLSDLANAGTARTNLGISATNTPFTPNGSIASTTVQAAIQEVRDEAGAGSGDALTTNPLSQFAATTSLQLKGVLSDETGSGAAVFATSPALVTPTGIVKGDVGLGNVDNTADASKPVSTAQQTAIDAKVSDTAYNATSWDGVTTVAPSKNAVRDQIEAMGSASVSDTAYAGSWDGVTTVAPSKNAVYDQVELRAPKASPTFTGSVVIPSGATLGTPTSVNLSNATALPATALPALTGDVTSSAGSAATTLAAVGTAGTYGSGSLVPVITTDAKGRVTGVTTASPTTRPPAIAKILARQQLR